jgi:hypothetical protein
MTRPDTIIGTTVCMLLVCFLLRGFVVDRIRGEEARQGCREFLILVVGFALGMLFWPCVDSFKH